MTRLERTHAPSRSRPFPVPLALLLVLAFVALPLAACGGGGGGGGPATQFSILTTTLPSAGVSVAYSTDLAASGGDPPYAWTLATGSSLPAGLSLAADGRISGTPTAAGSYGFSIACADSSPTPETATAAYTLDVSTFSASVGSLHWGEAWTGQAYPLAATGGGSVTFSFVTNLSGGTITGAVPSAGTATYTAGAAAGTDRVRATSAGGGTIDVDVPVVPNPVANMVARFSTTDVWYLRFDGKQDASHSFASDFDQSLAQIGMRGATSFDAQGTTADQIAKAWIRKRTLAWANAYYLNGADGTPQGGGLSISFPFDEPLPPHVKPSPGAILNAAYNQFNVISFLHGSTSGVLGTAYLDDPANGSQENDTSTPSAGDLGVFVDETAGYFNQAYNNDVLPASPVSSSDVARLKSLLYETATSGDARWNEIRRIGEGFARTIAAIGAHEVGHSLSLVHTTPSQSGSIMNAAAVIAPSATYAFISSDLIALETALPGPNRGGVPATIALPALLDPPADLQIGTEDALPRMTCGAGSCLLHRRR